MKSVQSYKTKTMFNFIMSKLPWHIHEVKMIEECTANLKSCLHIDFDEHHDWFDAISKGDVERIELILKNAVRYVPSVYLVISTFSQFH